ncbi:DUF6798 domain-containing protein [Fusobacterium periodonticum]|uniref:DUF6798 domain-containing protein n=1 Tax=Fusobacterium periodonticum TaxID=860 RepID=UPI0028D91235|nr:DUF6798 domain-containing protein [Fusobacterium periodonticum]
MKKKILKNDLFEFLFLLLISLSIVFLFSLNYLNQDNCNYAIEEIHQYDNKIFNGNINTLEANFSARYYANAFMAFFMRIFDLNWFGVAFRLIKINYILYALVAIVTTIKFLKKNRLLGCFLLSLCLMTDPLISISFGLNFAPDVFLGTAAPLTFLALVCVLGKEKYWEIAWILTIISTFLHVHEGFWSAFLLGIIWLAVTFADKKINFRVLAYILIYLFCLGLIVGPSMINASPVDADYFTQVYVYIRTPHHLLLSSIGKESILKATLLLLFSTTVLFIDFFKYRKYRNIKRTLFIIVFISIVYFLLYFLHYFSTEILKIPFIITMYIPKSFRFFTFLGLVNYIILGLRRIKKKSFLKGILLLLVPLTPNLSSNSFNYIIVLIYLIIFILLERFEIKLLINKSKEEKINLELFFIEVNSKKRKVDIEKLMNTVFYLLIFLIIIKNNNFTYKRLLLLSLGIFIYEYFLPFIKNIKTKNIFLVFILFLFSSVFYKSMKGKIFNLTENGYQCISGEEYAQKAIDFEVYDLAMNFKSITDESTTFLSDPYAGYSNYFQLFSERNSYVLYKNMPSQKHLVIEWYTRIEKVQNIGEANPEELKELLEDINLEYILLTDDRFEDILNSGLFIEVVRNNKYGIFKLKDAK